MGCRAEGNPIKGFPAGCSPAKTHKQNPRQQEETAKRFDSLARAFALDEFGVRHAAISAKFRPRGHPRAACGPPFSVLGCARGATGLDFAFCGKRGGALPLHPASLLKKAGPKTCFVLTFAVNYCQKSKNFRIQTKLSPIPPHICHILSGKRTIFSRRNVIE